MIRTAELRRRRYIAGLDRTSLAERAGCSVAMLSKIETGDRNPSPALLVRIAEVLGCDPADLIEFEEAS